MRKAVLAISLFLGVAAMAAPTPAPGTRSTGNTPAVKSYLMPELSLRSVISPDFLPVATKKVTQPATRFAGSPRKTGFCRCSCGFPCTSDADCGGTSCDPFITCCDKNSRNRENELFFQGAMNSSHKTPLPEDVRKASCK